MLKNILASAVISVLAVTAYADNSQTANTTVAVTAQSASSKTTTAAKRAALAKQIKQLQTQINQLQSSVNNVPSNNVSKFHVILDASDNVLFETFPSANSFSLAALQAKNQFNNGDLVFGGYIEQDTQYWDGDSIASSAGSYETGSQIALTTAKFDTMADINTWTTGFVSLAAANLSNNNTAGNNTIKISKAFLILGNLQQSPLYAVLGKTYLPFGSFGGGGPWTAPLDRMYFRPSETNQAALGYFQNGLNTNLALFSNNNTNNGNNYTNDFAYSLNYSQKQGQWNYSLGAGYLNDLRGTTAGVSSSATGSRNYALDAHAGVGYNLFALSSEYVQGSNSVASNSGKPAAWNFTGTYSPTLAGKLTLFSLSRDMTTQLANVPVGLAGYAVPGATATAGLRNQWTAAVDREFFPNVYIGLELETAKTYTAQNTYTSTIDVSAYF